MKKLKTSINIKLKKFIDFVVEIGVLLSFTGMILTVVIQVFTRFFMYSAPAWTEEVARTFFIYAVAFGAGLAIRDNSYVYLDYFIDKFSASTKYYTQLVIRVIILLFGILLFYYSMQFVQLGFVETSPALEIKMSLVFSSMLILGILIIYYSALGLIDKIIQSKT